MSDMERASEQWRPTAYWRGYAKRISTRLLEVGLVGYREDWEILKGHAMIGPIMPRPFAHRSKQVRLLKTLSRLPGFKQAVSFLTSQTRNENARHTATHDMLVSSIRQLLSTDPETRKLMGRVLEGRAGLVNPSSADPGAFSLDFLLHLAKFATVKSAVDILPMRRILEIGGGQGKFAEIFMKLGTDPNRGYCLIDIPPVLYIATQYLKAEFPGRVVDYTDLADADRITDADIDGKILAIPPWLIDRLDIDFDLFWNSASFQEMEKTIVTEYIDRVTKRCEFVGLSSLTHGHNPGAGGQLESIPLDWISGEVTSRGYGEVSIDKWTPSKLVLDILDYPYEMRLFQKLG